MFHISSDGQSRPCHARDPQHCPLGGANGENHYATRAEADKAIEQRAANAARGTSNSLSKNNGHLSKTPSPMPLANIEALGYEAQSMACEETLEDFHQLLDYPYNIGPERMMRLLPPTRRGDYEKAVGLLMTEGDDVSVNVQTSVYESHQGTYKVQRTGDVLGYVDETGVFNSLVDARTGKTIDERDGSGSLKTRIVDFQPDEHSSYIRNADGSIAAATGQARMNMARDRETERLGDFYDNMVHKNLMSADVNKNDAVSSAVDNSAMSDRTAYGKLMNSVHGDEPSSYFDNDWKSRADLMPIAEATDETKEARLQFTRSNLIPVVEMVEVSEGNSADISDYYREGPGADLGKLIAEGDHLTIHFPDPKDYKRKISRIATLRRGRDGSLGFIDMLNGAKYTKLINKDGTFTNPGWYQPSSLWPQDNSVVRGKNGEPLPATIENRQKQYSNIA